MFSIPNAFGTALAVLTLTILANAAAADELGGAGHWLARSHTENGLKFCYAISAPTESVGKLKDRGNVGALVTSLEGGATREQISVVLGYKPKSGTVIRAAIDGKNYILRRIEGDRAWAKDTAADQMIVAAMKRGNRMLVSGTSESGVEVQDTFSLSGLMKSLQTAADACGFQ